MKIGTFKDCWNTLKSQSFERLFSGSITRGTVSSTVSALRIYNSCKLTQVMGLILEWGVWWWVVEASWSATAQWANCWSCVTLLLSKTPCWILHFYIADNKYTILFGYVCNVCFCIISFSNLNLKYIWNMQSINNVTKCQCGDQNESDVILN